MTAPKTNRMDVHQQVTDRIITAIEAGAGEWKMPWHRSGHAIQRPRNFVTGKAYRGINVIGLWAAAQELGYSPLGRGYMSQNIQKFLESASAKDMRTSISRFSPENLRHDFDVRARFSKLAARLGRSEAELLLFWLLQQGQDIVLIPGTSKIDHLKKNSEAGALNLTDDEFRALDEFVRCVTLTGARTSDDMKSFLSF